MKANMKCSNCGAEINNMNFSWGKKYWLLVLPIMLLGFLPMIKLMFFKGDAIRDLVISEVQRKTTDRSIEVRGLITNAGSYKYSSVTVEAEFFDKQGNSLDEGSAYLSADIPSNGKEHFKITMVVDDDLLQASDTDMVVKIAGGNAPPF